MLLKQNGSYGIQVGHKPVFTREGALERYTAFLEVCYPLTVEGSLVLGEVQSDLVNAGFSWEEVEQIEIDYLRRLSNA